MIDVIKSAIRWDMAGEGARENGELSIKDAAVAKDGKSLSITLGLNFVVPYESHEAVCSTVMEKINSADGMGGIEKVCLKYEYEELVQPEEDAIRLFVEHMIIRANGDYAHITRTIMPERTEVSDDEIKIYAVGQMAADNLNKDVAPLFGIMLKELPVRQRKIVFLNNEETWQKTRESLKEKDRKELEESARKHAEAEKKQPEKPAAQSGEGGGQQKWNGYRRKPKEDPVEGNKIMGRPITGQATPFSELDVEKGNAVVEGVLFEKEERTIKSGSKLVKLLITDGRSSICLKTFATEKKWDDINKNLKEGDAVRAEGEVQFDTFENELIIMIKNLEKGEVKERKDEASEKRVELHAHTKMSAMDGLSDAKALIKQAAKWGHKAIAITDHGVVQSFPDAAHTVYGFGLKEKELDIKVLYGVEAYLYDDEGYIDEEGNIDYKAHGYNHAILLAKNYTGLRNLYRLVSISHLDYFYKRPRMPKSVIAKYREGLILGSACEAGEVYRSISAGEPLETQMKKAQFYDYLEIQPLINNRFMIASEKYPLVRSEEDIKDLNRKVIQLGEKCGLPVAATCDTHYINEEDSIYRDILLTGQGFKDTNPGLYFRTTEEMLEEFSYLGEEKAKEIVIDVPGAIADQIEDIIPIAKGKFPPKIENAEETLRTRCIERAEAIYGSPLPEPIGARLEKELNSIISNGYAVMYVSAEMLVQKSLSDGFLVGSRGSVGSSFAATMAGITEVNPLKPHYICPKCKHLEWGDENEYDCGVDMPEKNCPECGTKMKQDGFTIPFETFLGFEGNKEPDIDLNFAGEYQAKAHKYVETIFGSGNVYKAGTIGTIMDKTAFGFVRKYAEEKNIPVNKYETERLLRGCVGVKRTTGQHPGGIIIVPEGHEIYEFCPVQHPANDVNTDIVTTHFDYHSIDENLLKLDILGHDAPSMIRQLQDMTGIDPLSVPLKDERVNGIFNGIEGLDIKDENYQFTHGSYGIPEFGTRFVRQMLDDTQPKRFGDLVRISGFSHGTNVWLDNAQRFIKEGKATMQDAISTRDDIMNYLILKDVPNNQAFTIMEHVRKGKGLTEEEEKAMKEHDVPEWYIESCKLISYMFPRAHAVAYVIMSYRIAWYKVYYPREFYAVLFTAKINDFNWDVIKRGPQAILDQMDAVLRKGKNATPKEVDEIVPFELAYEMYSRGYSFSEPSLEDSEAVHFTVKDGKVQVPLCALAGLGESAGKAIEEEYRKKEFTTVEELQSRAGVNKTAIEAMRENGLLDDLPESDQMCMF